MCQALSFRVKLTLLQSLFTVNGPRRRMKKKFTAKVHFEYTSDNKRTLHFIEVCRVKYTYIVIICEAMESAMICTAKTKACRKK